MSLPESKLIHHDPYCFDLENSTIRKNFPSKLFDVLSDEANTEILQWLTGGNAFIIYDKKRFAANILPRYFKQSQFTSFTRKLSRWSFIRVNRGPLMGAYYHKLFQRDKPALCRMMSCKGKSEESLDLFSMNGVKDFTSNETPVPILAGQDPRSAEDMLSLIMLKHSAREVSIAQQALDARQARINRLLQMQRCKQACQALGIPVDSNLPLTELVQAESHAGKSASHAPCINAYDMDFEMRARTADRDRRLAHARMTARAMAHLEDISKPIAQSAQLHPTQLQLTQLHPTLLQFTPLHSTRLQSPPLHMLADRALSQNEVLDSCFRPSAT